MSIVAFLAAAVILLPPARTTCQPHAPVRVRLHWSERANVDSPGCRWRLQVRPHGDDSAFVYLVATRGRTHRLLFTVLRDGIVHWGRDDNTLLLEDERYSDRYHLELFRLDQPQSDARAHLIDTLVRADVEHRLRMNPGEEILYYFPHLVQWSQARLVVAVGVTTAGPGDGPARSHCLGYALGTDGPSIRARLSATEMERRFKRSCQVYP